MSTRKSKKAGKPAVEEMTEGMVELAEGESEEVHGGTITFGGSMVAMGDGSVRYHNYKSIGTIAPETL